MHQGSVLPVSFLSLVSCLPHWLPGHEGRMIRQSLDPIKLRWLTLWLTFDRAPWGLFRSLWVRGLRSEECLPRSLQQGKCPRSPDAQFLEMLSNLSSIWSCEWNTKWNPSVGFNRVCLMFGTFFVVLWSSLDFGRAFGVRCGHFWQPASSS